MSSSTSTSTSTSDAASASASASVVNNVLHFVDHSPEELRRRRNALKDESYVSPYSEDGNEDDRSFSRYVNHLKKYKFDFYTFKMVGISYMELDLFTDPKTASVALVDAFIDCVGSFQNYADDGGDVTNLYQNSRDGSYFYSVIHEFNRRGYFPQSLLTSVVEADTTGILRSIRNAEDKAEALEWFTPVDDDLYPYYFGQTYESFVLFMLINFPQSAMDIKHIIEALQV